ncbi:hypothetical protein ZWY2020_012208 [Hordeum vulgare]|nr:hypothetical protein ZWY2020_012208 [Hordeum vulgare]
MAGGGEGVGEAALVDVVEEVVGVVGRVPEAVDPGGEGGVGGAAPDVLDVGGGHLEAEELVGEARASHAPPGRRQASLKVRRRVGKYELGRTIGEGTFAKVRFAKDTESGDHVAIKILDKAKVQKHGLVEQIRREICTMKLIQHPNVVRLHEVMGSKARIFIVLEYVTGGELHDIILENLLLDTAGNLKVSDFGLMMGYYILLWDTNYVSLSEISGAEFTCPSWFSHGAKSDSRDFGS